MINNFKSVWEIESGWFSEKDTMWPGISLWLKVKKVLLEQKTKFQDILIFESESFWNVLVLDWVIQLTQRDEASYQEMLAHLPLFNHLCPERVLIIWGWDLWILREVVKHNTVKDAVLCEIDEWVINASKKFFPEISANIDNTKTKILIWDWSDFLNNNKEKFDVIIVDSSDPIWPANSLFTKDFYKSIKDNLSIWWIVAIQWESLFLHRELASNLKGLMKDLFKFADYSQVHVPTYPGWNIWLLVCSDIHDVKSPVRRPSENMQNSLKYYSEDIHKASFVLPEGYKN